MSLEVTPCSTPEELSSALNPILHYFGGALGEADLARWLNTIDIPRMHRAREDGAVVGGAGAFTFNMSAPGGSVPSAGVTVVGVLPTHRRRGVLTAMMRAQLDDVHRRGEPVAWLWASEETIYTRFGYGMASLSADMEVPRGSTAFARPFERRGDVTIVNEAEALKSFPAVWDALFKEQPGMFSRSPGWWQYRRLADSDRGRAVGGGVLNRALLTLDGRPAAYALYRIHQVFEGGSTNGSLNVMEAVGATPEATRELWHFLLNIDWVARVKAGQLPVDHPLMHLVARPRLLRFRLMDGVWVRLVDLQKALLARTIAPGPPIVIEVSDAFCPWNEGRWRIGEGDVSRTDASPDLACDVNALGSIYLGGFSLRELLRAGVIEERTAGAAARADAIFPRDRAPWCPEIF